MTNTITLDPDPPQRGQVCKVEYDGPLPQTLRWRTDDGEWESFELTEEDPSFDIPIPSNANTLRVEDLSGGAPWVGGPCV